MTGKYDDIIGLPHHVSPKRAPMSMIDRAAQFSPFAALTGYEATIAETARLTDERIQLDAGGESLLDESLREILAEIESQPKITVKYFRPDQRKQGGAYVNITGRVKKIDEYEQAIVLTDGMVLYFSQIYGIDRHSNTQML